MSAALLLEGAAEILRPIERLRPSAFAAEYRHLKPGTTHAPGRWSNEVFPFLVPVMDAVEEAITTGRRGVVAMKAGQIGGSEAIINAVAWLKTYYPGPMLYLISKEETAREFGRERFGYLIDTCDPLRKRALRGRLEGELVHTKRFVDGKLVVAGGRSVLNLETTPYRFVIIDEYDSLQDEILGRGDPLSNAEIRTDAYASLGASTLVIAFAHPTTKERGAGRLYYERSDQRRAFVKCVHCGDEKNWLSWEHVKVLPEGEESADAAARDPRRYHYVAPCCGAEISDGERSVMAARTVQHSTLPEAQARAAPWIGLHISQLYAANKPLLFLAEKWIEGLDEESRRRVFVNKRLGDTYEPAQRETTAEDWRGCIVVPRREGDPEAYALGQVPPGVQFLTAGQDSRTVELHWSVWGWGLVRDAGDFPHLCGWLVDCGVVEREYTPTIEAGDLAVFGGLIYDRGFARLGTDDVLYVRQGLHDSGWCPVAAYGYCLTQLGRAAPAKGASEDSASVAPPIRWGAPPTWRVGIQTVSDPRMRLALLNTYLLKESLFGLVGKRFDRGRGLGMATRIKLPADVPERFIAESSSEHLTQTKGRAWTWAARGPEHFSDCNIMAYAAALQLNPFLGGRTREDHVESQEQRAQADQRRRLAERQPAVASRRAAPRFRPVRRRY